MIIGANRRELCDIPYANKPKLAITDEMAQAIKHDAITHGDLINDYCVE
jgi:hypothetical protein